MPELSELIAGHISAFDDTNFYSYEKSLQAADSILSLLRAQGYGRMVEEKHSELKFIEGTGGLIKCIDSKVKVFQPIEVKE